ncbi:hypothetical protein DL89DRAFT_270489 [Linderina pennispora]|uniref:DDE Tnp4 domain-containing protein n=1 Tax=Linderina pennispora TaxID=61395 RepID=A0A1Y1VYN1_9FUNG|nr:uncharacterized protein DL89DRAFT_270489 [Linderina pennispora]ORX65934.1 hypothetical protein DL89DRAFT_270489 [Linderina pennispora]
MTEEKEQEDFGMHNFCLPIRKQRGVNLLEAEVEYNSHLGSFRLMVENIFGELGTTFKRLSNKEIV